VTARRIPVNNIEIYFEAFGDPTNPAVILVTGMDDHCTSWIPDFYKPIEENGYCVIRFDNRDCGLSTWIDAWDKGNPYTLEDMAGDTLALMNALNIDKAHFIGASMGGMIAQRIAISFSDRILTLTSIASSAFPGDPGQALKIAPPSNNRIDDSISLEEKYPNRETVVKEAIEYRLEALKVFAGSRFPVDEKLQRKILKRNILERRGYNSLANLHQTAAIIASGSRLNELKYISAPSLIIHGTEDPLLHPGHAVKCAEKIPDAKLVLLEEIGHELPIGIMDTVHNEIFNLFSRTLRV
jgi:pimeloyl-ACP methyl ester carboxylesterase